MKKNIMGFSFLSIWHAGFCIVSSILAGLILGVQDARAAWYEEHPGSDVEVHFVHLTGHGGDNDVNRRNLLVEHQACVDRKKAFGLAASPLSAGGFPPVIFSENTEIYYASNRVLTVDQGTAYFIDKATCELTARPRRLLKLVSAIGRCDMDLGKKSAVGACDEKAQEQAPNSTMAKIVPGKIPAVDLDKVPPQMRAQIAAQVERLKQLPQGSGGLHGTAPAPSGGYKTIMGYRCETYRAEALRSELCIAHPRSPFPIPAAPLNGGIPGLLLDADTPALTLHVQDVKMNMRVSKSLFAIPGEVKVTRVPTPRAGP